MAMQRSKNRARTMTSGDILNRFSDGRIMDTGEFYDRMILNQQVGLLLSMPQKRTPNRIR